MSEVCKVRNAVWKKEDLDLGDQLSCCQREALVNYTQIPGTLDKKIEAVILNQAKNDE